MIASITEKEKDIELKRILVIDENEENIEKIEQVRPSADYVKEQNLLSGLIRLAKEEFQLTFIEISRIPERELISAMAGYNKIGKIRQKTKIILLTDVYGEPIARNLVNRKLANDYLITPLQPYELNSVINRLFKVKINISGSYPLSEIYCPSQEFSDISVKKTSDFLRESAELVLAAELGLQALLGRICWSAIFLLDAQAARITIEDQTAQAGKETDTYNFSFTLSEPGKEFGKLDLLIPNNKITNKKAIDFIEQIVPGLVRLARSQIKLKELANTDELTGLANRRFMYEVLERLFERAQTERFRITLVIFDFDDFKHYNDTYGHGAGDEILRESAMLIKRCIRSKDLAARYGGDEFAVILWDWQQRRQPDSEHPRSALAIMQRFRKLLRQHYFPRLGPDAVGRLTISGGLASYPWDASNMEELIERADAALLEAKRSGKDRIYLVGQGAEEPEE